MAKHSATQICSYTETTINVRDKNLVDDMIGKDSFTQAFLYQALGKEPSVAQLRAVDIALVTIMEHGLVPSVVASRLTLHGAPESLQGAVAAGLLGVGDQYAGTASLCANTLTGLLAQDCLDTAAGELVSKKRRLREPIPGFGHPIHTGRDPRVEKLLETVSDDSRPLQAARAIEKALSEELGRPLVMNVSTALAVILLDAEIPAAMIRGVVLIARCAGLVGHLLEETEQPIGDALWNGATSAITQGSAT